MTPSTSPARFHEIDAATLRDWLQDGRAVALDVRSPGEHAAERLPGSLLTPMSTLDPHSLDEVVAGRRPVLYCRSGNRSGREAQALLAAGLPEITHLRGGIQAWRAAGLPVERTQGAPLDLLRQVQIIAGGSVLAAVLLGAWLHPGFLALAGAVGAGLLGAGLSGNCLLASILSRLPYNQRFAADRIACAPVAAER